MSTTAVLTRSATGDFLRFCFSTSTCILAMGLAMASASLASACSFFCRLRKSRSSRDSLSSSVVSLSEYEELCLDWGEERGGQRRREGERGGGGGGGGRGGGGGGGGGRSSGEGGGGGGGG